MAESSSTEIEARLAVVGSDREDLFESVKALSSIVDVRVGPFSSLELRDEYFDDEAGTLLSQDCALRLRQSTSPDGTRVLMTFKGPAEYNGTHCMERTEHEEVWSSDFMRRIMELLSQRGMELGEFNDQDDPQKAFAALGLKSVQVRHNHRQLAHLGLESKPLAEIALDCVSYRAGEYTVQHREIEIEARGETSPEELLTLAGDLEEAFRGRLLPWPWSKTGVGRGLNRMNNRGDLKPFLDSTELNADGYHRLSVYLKLGAFLQQD